MSRSRLYPPSVDPGFPVLPPCPDGWRRTTFRDVVEVVERPVKLEPDRVYKLVTAKRSRGGIVLRSETPGREVLTKTQFETRAGDFLISRRQIIHGACGVVPAELDGAVVSNEYAALRPRPGLSMEFLRHYSHTPYFQRTCFHSSHGVDVEKMIFKIDEWLAREVDVPPLPEQRKISAILSSVDENIDRTQKVIDQLQVVQKAAMTELLTRGLPGRPTQFTRTEIGEVPAGWRLLRISEFAKLGSGTTPSRQTAEYFTRDGGTPWVKTMDLNDGLLTCTDEQVTPRALREAHLRVYPEGTVLVAMYGGFQQIGRTAILGVPAATNQALCPIEMDRSTVEPRFLNLWLIAQRPRWRNIAASSRKDPNITKQDVGNFLVAIPSMDEQLLLVDAHEALATRLAAESSLLDVQRRLRSALTSALLTGELRVPSEAIQ